MATESKELELLLKSVADTSGIEKINAGLTEESAIIQKVTGEVQKHTQAVTEQTAAIAQATERQTAFNEQQEKAAAVRGRVTDNTTTAGAKGDFTGGETRKVDYASIAAEREAAAAIVNANDEKEIGNAAQKNAIASQAQVIAETKLALIQATLAGEEMEAEKLKGEVAIRSIILQQMRQQTLTQAEMNELAATEEGLLNASIASIEAKAAAEAEAAAAKEKHVYGPRSRAGSLLKNFVDPNMAGAAGIGIFGGMMLKNAIEEYTKKLEKVNEERDKESAKLVNEVKLQQQQIRALDSMADAEKMRVQIQGEIAAAQEKARFASDEQKAAYQQQAITLQAQLRILDSQRERIAASAAAAERMKESFKADAEALDLQLRKLDQIKDRQHEQLDFENQRAELVMKNALAELKQQLDLGKITEAQYNERKADLEAGNEHDRSAAKVKALEQEKANLQAQLDAATGNLSGKNAQSDSATGLQEFFAQERNTAQKKLDDINNAVAAVAAAKEYEKKAGENLSNLEHGFHHGPDREKNISKAKTDADEAHVKTASASKHLDDISGDRPALTVQIAAAQKAYDDLKPYAEAYKKQAEDALAAERKALEIIPAKIDAAKTQIAHEQELQTLREKGQQISKATIVSDDEAKTRQEDLRVQKQVNEKKIQDLQNQVHDAAQNGGIHVGKKGKDVHGRGSDDARKKQIQDLHEANQGIDRQLIDADPRQKKLAGALNEATPDKAGDKQAAAAAEKFAANPGTFGDQAGMIRTAADMLAKSTSRTEETAALHYLLDTLQKRDANMNAEQKRQAQAIRAMAQRFENNKP